MKWNPLRIGELVAEVPIIQGGMGVGISLSRLASAVAKEGGIGLISSAQIGFREEDFQENPKEANLRAIRQEYHKARASAPQGIIGFNMMVASKHYDEYAMAAAKAGADIIVSGAGLPTDLPAYVAGTATKIAPIVSTAKSTRVILKYWDRKYQRTADLLVIEGPLAGGHLGFTPNQLEQYDRSAYDQEIADIITIVKEYEEKYECSIPVALAGGIDCSEQVAHAFALGADAVQVGTSFVTTWECDAHLSYKESYLQATKDDIAIIKSPVGMPGRAILNPFMKKIIGGEMFSPKVCRQCLQKCNPSEIPYCITERLINAASGQIDEALLFCGAKAYRQNQITTVKEVIQSLMG